MTDEKIPFATYVIQQIEAGKLKRAVGFFGDTPDFYVDINRLLGRTGWATEPDTRDSWNLFFNIGWIFKSVVLTRGKLRTKIRLTKEDKKFFYEFEKRQQQYQKEKAGLAAIARKKEIEELQGWP